MKNNSMKQVCGLWCYHVSISKFHRLFKEIKNQMLLYVELGKMIFFFLFICVFYYNIYEIIHILLMYFYNYIFLLNFINYLYVIWISLMN